MTDLDDEIAQRITKALEPTLKVVLNHASRLEALEADQQDQASADVMRFEGEFLIALADAAEPADFVQYMRDAIPAYFGKSA